MYRVSLCLEVKCTWLVYMKELNTSQSVFDTTVIYDGCKEVTHLRMTSVSITAPFICVFCFLSS